MQHMKLEYYTVPYLVCMYNPLLRSCRWQLSALDEYRCVKPVRRSRLLHTSFRTRKRFLRLTYTSVMMRRIWYISTVRSNIQDWNDHIGSLAFTTNSPALIMNLDGQVFIACTNCAKAKAKCDKKVALRTLCIHKPLLTYFQTPCTRCVTKKITCEPRSTRRSHNFLVQKQTKQLRALEPRSPQSDSNAPKNTPKAGRSPASSGSVESLTNLQLQTPVATDSALSQPATSQFSSQNIFTSNKYLINSDFRRKDADGMIPHSISPGRETVNTPALTAFEQSNDYTYLGMEDSQTSLMDLDMTDLMNPMFSEIDYPNGDTITPFDTLLGSWAEHPPYSSSTYTLGSLLFSRFFLFPFLPERKQIYSQVELNWKDWYSI